MSHRNVEPPSFPRLRRRIATLDASAVCLYGWPASGRRALLRALARQSGARAVGVDGLPRPGRRGARFWVVERLLAPATAAAVVRSFLRRSDGPRLVLAVRGVPAAQTRMAVVTPQELLLTAPELERLFASVGAPPPAPSTIDRLLLDTEGWLGPLAWALRQQPRDPIAALGSPAFARRARRLLARLPEAERDVLAAVAQAPGFEAAAFERLWRGDPARRTALATARAMLAPEGSPAAPLRLPPILADALWRYGETHAERRARHARLARLAAAGGRRGLARHHRRLAGDADPGRLVSTRAASSRPTVRILLQLLGHPRVLVSRGVATGAEIEASSSETVRWRLRRAFQLVAYLALQPSREAARDELVDALWPERDEDFVRRNLHPMVSDARRALRRAAGAEIAPILCQEGRYRLSPTVDWRVDVDDFLAALVTEDASPEASLERLRVAWRRYRGPLLIGSYDTWVERRRDALHQRYLGLLRRIGDLSSELGREVEALDAYRALLIEDPFEERVHVAVMELYAAAGRRDLVRRQFVNLEDRLKELGVAPAAETLTRYHQLMR